MLARVTEPGSYQAFQHFITHAPWRADAVWRRLRTVLPVREGVLILDGTTFLKQGRHSVGVTRQYSGLQGQIVNCQAAVTAALWSGGRAFLVGAALYLPQSWLTDDARVRGHIPASVPFQEKWRLALTLLRQVRASGIRLTGVLADAEFGDKRAFRGLLHRLRLPYAVGVSTHLTAFRGSPRLTQPRALPGSHRRRLAPGVTARPIAELVANEKLRWRRVQWRNRHGARMRPAECAAMRVTPALDHRQPRLSPEIWLLVEREVGSTAKTRFFYVNLPATASLVKLLRFAHQRWPIEQQYQELKTELGLIISRDAPTQAGSTTSSSPRSRTTFCRSSVAGLALVSPFQSSVPSSKRSSPRTCLRNDLTTSNGSRPFAPSNSGSDKVVPDRVHI